MSQLLSKHSLLIAEQALKELSAFPQEVQYKCKALLEVLADEGYLRYPYSKKLAGQINLFELRVKKKGQWRIIYTYSLQKQIVVLSAFKKTSQKTPLKEIKKAYARSTT